MNKIKHLTFLLKEHEAGEDVDKICTRGYGLITREMCSLCFFVKRKENITCEALMEKWLIRLNKVGVVSGWEVDWAKWEDVKAKWKAEKRQRKLDKEENNVND